MGPMHSYYGKNIKDTNEKGEKYPFKESLQKTRNFPTKASILSKKPKRLWNPRFKRPKKK